MAQVIGPNPDAAAKDSASRVKEPLLSASAQAIYDAIDAAKDPSELERSACEIWRAYYERKIDDDDATFLQQCVQGRRPTHPLQTTGNLKHVSRLTGPVGSRFKSRQRQRSSNKKASRDRRRTLGASSMLPAKLRCDYTEGQRAVLGIIAGEVKKQGFCDLFIDRIAATAGVCRTTAQSALHEARRLGHLTITERPRPGRKHLSNIIKITDAVWSAWLKGGLPKGNAMGSKK